MSNQINEIEKEIKKEWRIFKKFSRKNEDKLLLLSIVVVISAVVIVNTIYILNKLPSSANKPVSNNLTIAPNTIIKSSLKGSNLAYDVVISDITENDTPDKAFAQPADYTMLIAKVSITNKTNSRQQLVPTTQIYLRTRDGLVYSIHPSMYVKDPIGFAEIEPSKTITGQVSFGIPKTVTAPLLYVDLGWQDTTPIVYDVLH